MWRNVRLALSLCAFAALASGCGGGHNVAAVPIEVGLSVVHHPAAALPNYVIVMVQENRTVDNLFQKQPGVDTQSFGFDSHHTRINLRRIPLGDSIDCDHRHKGFVLDATQGFDVPFCGKGVPLHAAFSYVNPADITQYTTLATQYAFADHVLQSNEGDSYPAHIYLIAATSGTPGSHWNIAENGNGEFDGPLARHAHGCNDSPDKRITTIDMTSPFPGVEGNPIFPCIDPPTIFNELDSAHISWKYYTPSVDSLWNSVYAIKSLYDNDQANVIVPETTVLSDIQDGHLAHVSYVIPSGQNSDHPSRGDTGGPTWVASVVNALGESKYWNKCAVIVVWDDWGGWYDHVAYRHPAGKPIDPFEYGYRVPLIAIGPYAKSNWVDHTDRDFAAIPHFIERVYGLGSLGALDAQTDDLFSMFNFGGTARKFSHIPTGKVTIKSLIDRPPDLTPVDSD